MYGKKSTDKASETENISNAHWSEKAAEKLGTARLNYEGANMYLQAKFWEKIEEPSFILGQCSIQMGVPLL